MSPMEQGRMIRDVAEVGADIPRTDTKCQTCGDALWRCPTCADSPLASKAEVTHLESEVEVLRGQVQERDEEIRRLQDRMEFPSTRLGLLQKGEVEKLNVALDESHAGEGRLYSEVEKLEARLKESEGA